MGATTSEAWAEIFKDAVTSPLGIIGLAILVAGSVVITLFRPQDKPSMKLAALAMLLLFCGGAIFVALYFTEPIITVTQQAPNDAPESPVQPHSRSQGALSIIASQAAAATAQLKLAQAPAPPSAPRPPAENGRASCGTEWTQWVDVKDGSDVQDPCPPACTRGPELARSFRVVGFPPRPQARYMFQCWRR